MFARATDPDDLVRSRLMHAADLCNVVSATVVENFVCVCFFFTWKHYLQRSILVGAFLRSAVFSRYAVEIEISAK